jgi:hypothetical protein
MRGKNLMVVVVLLAALCFTVGTAQAVVQTWDADGSAVTGLGATVPAYWDGTHLNWWNGTSYGTWGGGDAVFNTAVDNAGANAGIVSIAGTVSERS